METVVANLIAGKVRRATLHGREYLVAPLTLIVPGVLNGSKGPLFYPADEIAKNSDAWNGVSILVQHPNVGGTNVSARDPEVVNRQEIGRVFRVRSNGKLRAEGWFDVEATKRIDNRILGMLEAGQKIEVSTGLYTDNEPAENGAKHKGQAYSYVARNYRPDHVAVLLDQKGACSVDDGCGVNVNQALGTSTRNQDGRKSRPSNGELENKGDAAMAMNPVEKKAIVDGLIANCEGCGWEDADRSLLMDLSDEHLVSLQVKGKTIVANAAKAAKKEAAENAGALPFKGAAPAFGKKDAEGECDEDDQECLDMMEENSKKKATKNQRFLVRKQTDEEWLASAPPGIRAVVQNAMAVESQQREELVSLLTENVEDDATREKLSTRLAGKPLDELRELTALLPQRATIEAPAMNYSGMAAGSSPTSNKSRLTPVGLPCEYLPPEKVKARN